MNENERPTMQAADPAELEQVEGGSSAADYVGLGMIYGSVAVGCPALAYAGHMLAPWWEF